MKKLTSLTIITALFFTSCVGIKKGGGTCPTNDKTFFYRHR